MDFGSALLKKLIIMISCFAFREISFEFRLFFNFVFREIFAKLKENFAKLKENFSKHEIVNFSTFSRKHENESFRSHPSVGLSLLISVHCYMYTVHTMYKLYM